jgi:recombinational DNA repair protein (RecF pathway)
MGREELLQEATCVSCGETVSPGLGRAFLISDDDFLCFECAEERGGRWDERRDAWVEAPDLRDLMDAHRAHA